MRRTPGYEPVAIAPQWRVATVLLVSVIVEVLRYQIHPGDYVGNWWAMVGACLCCNGMYHWWSLPDTQPKAIVSAWFSETSMPELYNAFAHLASSTGAAVWLFLQQNMSGLQLHS